jgi:hypothetical protein
MCVFRCTNLIQFCCSEISFEASTMDPLKSILPGVWWVFRKRFRRPQQTTMVFVASVYFELSLKTSGNCTGQSVTAFYFYFVKCKPFARLAFSHIVTFPQSVDYRSSSAYTKDEQILFYLEVAKSNTNPHISACSLYSPPFKMCVKNVCAPRISHAFYMPY